MKQEIKKEICGEVRQFLRQRERLKNTYLNAYGSEGVNALQFGKLDVAFLESVSEETVESALRKISSNWDVLFVLVALLLIGASGAASFAEFLLGTMKTLKEAPMSDVDHAWNTTMWVLLVLPWMALLYGVRWVTSRYDSGQDCTVLELDCNMQINLIQKMSKISSAANAYREAVLSKRRLRLFDVKVMQVLSKREAYALMHPMIDDRKVAR